MKKEKVISAAKQNALLLCAIAFMIVPVVMAYMPWMVSPAVEAASGWGVGPIRFGAREARPAEFAQILMPDMFSTLGAIGIYAGIVIRGNIETFKSPVKIILLVLNVLFIASFTKVFLSSEHWKLFGFLDLGITSQTIFFITIAISWLGMKTIAGFSWIILFLAAIGTMTEVNTALGAAGAMYILSPFISIGMQLAGRFINIGMSNLKDDFFASANIIKGDINHSIDTTKRGVNAAIGMAATAATGVPIMPQIPETKEKEQ